MSSGWERFRTDINDVLQPVSAARLVTTRIGQLGLVLVLACVVVPIVLMVATLGESRGIYRYIWLPFIGLVVFAFTAASVRVYSLRCSREVRPDRTAAASSQHAPPTERLTRASAPRASGVVSPACDLPARLGGSPVARVPHGGAAPSHGQRAAPGLEHLSRRGAHGGDGGSRCAPRIYPMYIYTHTNIQIYT